MTDHIETLAEQARLAARVADLEKENAELRKALEEERWRRIHGDRGARWPDRIDGMRPRLSDEQERNLLRRDARRRLLHAGFGALARKLEDRP